MNFWLDQQWLNLALLSYHFLKSLVKQIISFFNFSFSKTSDSSQEDFSLVLYEGFGRARYMTRFASFTTSPHAQLSLVLVIKQGVVSFLKLLMSFFEILMRDL